MPFVPPVVRLFMPLMFLLGLASSALSQMPGQQMPGLSPIAVQQSEHGMRATMGSEVLDVTVCGASVIHVLAKPDEAAQTG